MQVTNKQMDYLVLGTIANCGNKYARGPTAIKYTFLLNECYTLPPVSSSSSHHSDGVACVVLEVSESGSSCCWVTELQGGLTTSLRMIGHSGGVEAVGSWA